MFNYLNSLFFFKDCLSNTGRKNSLLFYCWTKICNNRKRFVVYVRVCVIFSSLYNLYELLHIVN